MTSPSTLQFQSLAQVLEGWNGYHTSIIHAIEPLPPAQLAWRPAPNLRSVGNLARHISLGRVTWFRRMNASGSDEVVKQIKAWETDGDDNQHVVEEAIPITEDAAQLVQWLELTWRMVEATLTTWQTADLATTYRHQWNGTTYDVSHQWTIFRIMAHDIHHGGELSLMLGMQGIEAFELGALGGHIILPPVAA